MESLAKLNEPGDLTKDFRILPSADHIKSLIEQDANSTVEKITGDLLSQVESGRGKAETKADISILQRTLVVNKLNKWAGLYGYKCKVDGNNIGIILKGIKREPTKICRHCGVRSRKLTRFLVGAFGVSTSIGLTSFFAILFPYPYVIVSMIFVGLIASSISIGCASTWNSY